MEGQQEKVVPPAKSTLKISRRERLRMAKPAKGGHPGRCLSLSTWVPHKLETATRFSAEAGLASQWARELIESSGLLPKDVYALWAAGLSVRGFPKVGYKSFMDRMNDRVSFRLEEFLVLLVVFDLQIKIDLKR